jgi:phosphopantetheine--protein transferase-like protein
MLSICICQSSATPEFPHDEQLPSSLSARIRRNIESRVRQTDRHRSLSSYRLLYRELAKAGFAGHSLPEVDVDERGKPYLPAIPEMHISLSHGSDWLACALSSVPVGIDIETLPSEEEVPTDIDQVAQIFHPAERRWVAMREGHNKSRAFYLLWTRKEAYLKATGQGLSEGMDYFSALPGDRRGFRLIENATRSDGSAWALSLGGLAPCTILSVCLLTEDPSCCISVDVL